VCLPLSKEKKMTIAAKTSERDNSISFEVYLLSIVANYANVKNRYIQTTTRSQYLATHM